VTRPIPVADLWKQARDLALPPNTHRRARKELGICSTPIKVGDRTVTTWRYPDQQLAIADGDDPTGIFAAPRDLEQQFPPRTPLEDEEA